MKNVARYKYVAQCVRLVKPWREYLLPLLQLTFRKLADIGNTVRMQFNQISKWANLVTVHAIPGFGVLEAIRTAESYHSDFGIFLIAELSSENNLITPDYTKSTFHVILKRK